MQVSEPITRPSNHDDGGTASSSNTGMIPLLYERTGE